MTEIQAPKEMIMELKKNLVQLMVVKRKTFNPDIIQGLDDMIEEVTKQIRNLEDIVK